LELLEIKKQWNKGLERVNRAEKVAEDNPVVFEKFIGEFNKICRDMSSLMNNYEAITGREIADYEFKNGFVI
jgi:hypothetical protein